MNNKVIELRIPDVSFKEVMFQMRSTCPGENISKCADDFIQLMGKVIPHCKTQKHKDEIIVKVQLAALLTGNYVKNRGN